MIAYINTSRKGNTVWNVFSFFLKFYPRMSGVLCDNYPFSKSYNYPGTKVNVMSPRSFLFVLVQQVGDSLLPSYYYVASSQVLFFHVDDCVLKYNPHAFIFLFKSSPHYQWRYFLTIYFWYKTV